MLAVIQAGIYSRPMGTTATDPFLDAITRTIVDRFSPERVVLFGSRARGDHHPESDYDLIVVLETVLDRRERARSIRNALPRSGSGIDVIVYTPAEFERSRLDVGALAYAGETEGRILYERGPSRRARKVREAPSGEPDSLKDWLRRADNDMAAMADISAGSGSADAICFHAHRAVEKFLKAALIRNHVAPHRTHELPHLLQRSAPQLRDDPVLSQACELLHALWPSVRYPGHPMPTADEARAASAAAQAVRTAVLSHMRGEGADVVLIRVSGK